MGKFIPVRQRTLAGASGLLRITILHLADRQHNGSFDGAGLYGLCRSELAELLRIRWSNRSTDNRLDLQSGFHRRAMQCRLLSVRCNITLPLLQQRVGAGLFMDLDRGFELGGWTVRPRESLLVRGDINRHIEPRVMRVLVCLASHAPETVTRQELFDEVWTGVVVQDEVLSRNVSILRTQLDLESDHRQYIQTVTRIGYRLIELPMPLKSPPERKHEVVRRRSWTPVRYGSIVVAGLLAVLLAVFYLQFRTPLPAPSPVTSATRLSTQMLLAGYDSAQRRGESHLNSSIRLFRDALKRDPDAIEARLGLANALALLPSYASSDPELSFAEALTELQLFVAAGGPVERTHATAAFIQLHRMKLNQAEERFQAAIAFDPDDASVRQWYLQLLGRVGRTGAAIEQAEKALSLSDDSPVNHHRAAVSYVWSGDNERAAREFERASALGIAPFVNPEPRIILYFRNGQHEELIRLLMVLHEARGLDAGWIEPLEIALRTQAPEARAEAVRSIQEAWQAGEVDPSLYFGIPLFLGDINAALDAATVMAHRQRLSNVLEGFFLPEARGLRDQPRFHTLVRELGLHLYWAEYGLPDVCRQAPIEASFCAKVANEPGS
jgi:DNA-binding winged helix-turn-helix (wHTH) protein/tetratricopeptide (TPR) repeat protein